VISERADDGVRGVNMSRFKNNKLAIFLAKLLLGFAVTEATFWVYWLALVTVDTNEWMDNQLYVTILFTLLIAVFVVVFWLLASWCMSPYKVKFGTLYKLIIVLSFISLFIYRVGFLSFLFIHPQSLTRLR
jgi:hypothetical protein